MTGNATVGVYDDLASRQAGVALRTADDESPGRIDVDLRCVVDKVALYDGADDVLVDIGVDDFVVDFR